ncbi:MAG: BMP family ABC transporter substrate-binding protein [Clostridia bacterium]|nr:BMP family ABC transporter substrate-binding protein [Clostridia bacterium]
MKKRILALFLAGCMALGLVACGGGDSNPPAGGGSQSGDFELKVGAIYINSKNDTAGYTFAHHTGITTAMTELGMDPAELAIVDEVPEDDTEVRNAIDTLVGEGCNLIFGISFGYLNAFEAAAADYPDVMFSHGTGFKCNDTNFNNYFGRAYQARYLAGIAAGMKSLEMGNNAVGYVAAFGTDYAETASGINGFALGLQSVNPDATLYVKELGAWADEVNEYAFAEELINTYGCGVVTQHCDSAQPQIAAENAGVFGCGYNSDMTADAPAAHLTAAIWNWNVYYRTAMEAAKATGGDASKFVEKMGGPAYYGGLAEGFVDVSPLTDNCAPNTQAVVDAVKALIISGEWDVFSGVKLSYDIAADGTVTINKTDAPLKDNTGAEIVAAGGPSVEDGVITGSMNYFVEGVQTG